VAHSAQGEETANLPPSAFEKSLRFRGDFLFSEGSAAAVVEIAACTARARLRSTSSTRKKYNHWV